MMQSKRCHAQGDQEDNTVFVQGVPFSENGEMEEHDGQQFAGFGEDKS